MKNWSITFVTDEELVQNIVMDEELIQNAVMDEDIGPEHSDG